MLEVGQRYTVSKVVEEKDTAANVASGALEVFSTPMMIALMEEAAFKLIQENIKAEESSVGVEISVRHLKGTKIGKTVTAVATITEISDKFLSFEVKAFEENNILIGEGFHKRCIIDINKFLNKLN